MTFIIFIIIFFLIDIYLFQAILAVSKNWTPFWKSFIRYGFWFPSVLSVLAVIWWNFGNLS
ncbi:hypothetical protein KK060_18760, partial [Fulvivirgaceae bacterium PWU20]|nr:hypothetical protein [Chryseosolibacter indicus]